MKLLLLIGVAIGVPYVFTETEPGNGFLSRIAGFFDSVTGTGPVLADGKRYDDDIHTVGYANHAHHEVEKLRDHLPEQYRYDPRMASRLADNNALPTSITGGKIRDIREILRFDITPDWVISRFSRVTTILAETSLEGLRVPIVTGVRADDIAGSLTYYFDGRGKLQRVTIHGFTGNPEPLIGMMTKHYGLQSTPALEAGVFTKSWNGMPIHFLRLTHSPVVYSDAVHRKYTVFLELNEPSLAYGISPEARRVISSDRGTNRW